MLIFDSEYSNTSANLSDTMPFTCIMLKRSDSKTSTVYFQIEYSQLRLAADEVCTQYIFLTFVEP